MAKKTDKEFGLSSWSVDNRTTVFVILFIILIGGIGSYVGMPKEAFPEVVTPEIYVGTPYPGNSALDIEKLITRPIEKEINTITGVDKILSTSVQGYSTIQVKFDFSVTPEEALREVKDAVDKAMGDKDFPRDLPAEPNVFEMNFAELMPVMNINLSGDYTLDQLKEYAELLEDEIEDIPEVSKVDIRGIPQKEVKVLVDVLKMEPLEISFFDVENAIQNENMTMSGGDLLVDGFRRNVRVIGEFESLDDLRNLVVKAENQKVVYLKDIAEVQFEGEDPESYAREFGSKVVMLDVIKRGGENLINASDQINEVIKNAKKDYLPNNLTITITGDQSDQTRVQVGELENSIIFGMLLVIGVLLFFLGLRNALFVGVAIPLSMFMAFMLLSAMGVTLNMMVLFSMVLALGMLVDNGIVVVENVYRWMDEGYSGVVAAKKAVGEVAWPIIASTATTLGAFLPLMFWPGLMGEFMGLLPMTLIIVLGSSLFVALVVNPVLTSLFMKIEESSMKSRRFWVIISSMIAFGLLMDVAGAMGFGNLLIGLALMSIINKYVLAPAAKKFQEGFMVRLENFYTRILSFALKGKRPLGFLFGTIGLLFLSFIVFGVATPKVLFFPENMPRYVNVFIEMPIGTDIDETDAATRKLEKIVAEVVNDPKYRDMGEAVEMVNATYDPDHYKADDNYLIESVISQVGQGTSDPGAGTVSMGSTPEKGRIQVTFVKFQDRRGVMTNEVLKDIRKRIKEEGIPGVRVTVDKDAAGPPQGKPINIEIAGDDYFTLMAESNKIKKFIESKNIGGIEELKLDVEQGKPEMPIVIDRVKARRLGLSTGQIGGNIRTSLFGKEVSTYKDGEDDYDIVLRFNDAYRYNEQSLLNQKITFRNQSNGRIYQVPISSVAKSEKSSTFSAVKRKNLKRVITVQSNVLADYNPTEVVNEIKTAMNDYDLPSKMTMSFTGQQEEQAKEMSFLGTALLMAVGLILLIIVAQFNSISTPVIILGTVMLSMIGVLFGLVIFQMEFVIMMTMIGLISLAGIVVNNAIVLIDYTNLIQDRKTEELNLAEDQRLSVDQIKESIVQGGKTRLRPVLLTAITTVLGLVPLAVGLNIDFISLLTDLDPMIYVGGDNVIFWGPMSWTVIFGLTFATFLTLVIVPVMYYLFKRLKIALSNMLMRNNVISKPWKY